MCVCVLFAQSCPTLNPWTREAPLSMGFPGKNTGVGCHFLLQGIHTGLLEKPSDQIRSDQLLSRVRLFATPWIAARQASLSITSSRSSLRLTSIESAMPSSHLILCRPLLLLPPIPPSIRVFSNESTLRMIALTKWTFVGQNNVCAWSHHTGHQESPH